MTPFPPKKSAGDVPAPRRATNTEATVPAQSNVYDLAERREAVDNGRRLAVVEALRAESHERPVRSIHRPEIGSMLFDGLGSDPDPTPLDGEEVHIIGRELHDARTDLMAAAKLADRKTPAEIHQRLMLLIVGIEDLALVLREQTRGDAA